MIRRAFITNRNGEPVYGRQYSEGMGTDCSVLPVPVRASIILLASSKATSYARPYILKQSDGIWAYCFFESFVVLLESTPDENVQWLKRRTLSLGKHIAKNFSNIISSWPGEVAYIEGVSETIDEFVRVDLAIPATKAIKKIDTAINKVLSKYQVAYVGVFDAVGQMIVGNIPDSHIKEIKRKILQDAIKSSIDIAPTTMSIMGYDAQVLRVHTLTTVAAPYIGGSKMAAIKAVGDLAQIIEQLVKK